MVSDNRRKFQKQTEQPPRWRFRPVDADLARALTACSRLNPVLARIVAGRMRDVDEESALTQENLERFLSPRLADIHNPFELADMDKAVARVFNAVRRNEAITVYGDYDSDGTTATALLVHLFRFL
ncbi:MAG: hypothetical protein ACPL7D_01765, partial [Candidatus Sumerlaeaceae bacterium]